MSGHLKDDERGAQPNTSLCLIDVVASAILCIDILCLIVNKTTGCVSKAAWCRGRCRLDCDLEQRHTPDSCQLSQTTCSHSQTITAFFLRCYTNNCLTSFSFIMIWLIGFQWNPQPSQSPMNKKEDSKFHNEVHSSFSILFSVNYVSIETKTNLFLSQH